MHHGLQLDLKTSEILTIDPNETEHTVNDRNLHSNGCFNWIKLVVSDSGWLYPHKVAGRKKTTPSEYNARHLEIV